MIAESSNSLGFGGTTPRVIIERFLTVVFCRYSRYSPNLLSAKRFDKPSLLDKPKISCWRPRRMSQSTRSTFFLVFAKATARFEAIKLLPSFGVELVIKTAFESFLFKEKYRLVRIVRKSSLTLDFGLSLSTSSESSSSNSSLNSSFSASSASTSAANFSCRAFSSAIILRPTALISTTGFTSALVICSAWAASAPVSSPSW